MSIKVMSAVWESDIEDRGELLVMLALADFANDRGECWPSIRTIAAKARYNSDRSIQGILRGLEEQGYLTITAGGGRKNCNLYTINPAINAPQNLRGGAIHDTKPRKNSQETPQPTAPEPSRTIKDPQDFYSGLIKRAAPWAASTISAQKARGLVRDGLVTEEECRKAGVL